MSDAGAAAGSPRTPAENAELALLLEVAGTPKPGNVDRHRDLSNLRFEQFLAGAVGSAGGLREAADPEVPLGQAFEDAVAGMSRQSGGNTQFGCLLLLAPLVRAAATGPLTRDRAAEVVAHTTVDDAVSFYRAFEHVDVAVADPPEGMGDLDVRRGGDAETTLRERGLTLADVMAGSAEAEAADGDRVPDTNALEWTEGFPRTFAGAERLREWAAEDGLDVATPRLFLTMLAGEPDTLVATQHGPETAREVRERARRTLDLAERTDTLAPAGDLADEFVRQGINPGTTADRTAAALFVALERGLEV